MKKSLIISVFCFFCFFSDCLAEIGRVGYVVRISNESQYDALIQDNGSVNWNCGSLCGASIPRHAKSKEFRMGPTFLAVSTGVDSNQKIIIKYGAVSAEVEMWYSLYAHASQYFNNY